MAFKKVGGSRKFVKYSECKPGQVLVDGKFLRTEEGRFGLNHVFLEEAGETVLNSSGHLNWLLETYGFEGAVCRVTYLGKEKLTRGNMKGKEAHRFELEIDDDYPQPVGAATPAAKVKKPEPEYVASDFEDDLEL
jgi:hypothetical protein